MEFILVVWKGVRIIQIVASNESPVYTFLNNHNRKVVVIMRKIYWALALR
jgi:hypothetical protein